jgi:cold shock CspA family protein
MTGTVVRLMPEKRFGFLKGEDGKDYFFHQSDFHGFFDDLVEDFNAKRTIEVTFEVTPSDKGPRAAGVTRVDGGV